MAKKQHHKKGEFCYSRPAYREARWERAVKAYTINQESQYVLVQGVPSVGIKEELVQLFALYGEVEEYRLLDDYPGEKFTDVFWIKFKKIQSARFAKRKLDNRSFYGGSLHVCYAPEFESVDETRRKLEGRRMIVARKCKELLSTDCVEGEDGPVQDAGNVSDWKPQSQSRRHGMDLSATKCSAVPSSVASPDASIPIGFPSTATNEVRYYPMLPPPPTHQLPPPPSLHFPPYNFPHNMHAHPSYPPPPPPPPLPGANVSQPSEMYPRVPSKHATLPKHLQDIPALPSSNGRFQNLQPPQTYQRKEDSRYSSSTKATPKIVWRTDSPTAKEHPHDRPIKQTDAILDKSRQTFTTAQGPWDPYYKKRKASQSLTGDDNLDKVVDRVRNKLKKFSDT